MAGLDDIDRQALVNYRLERANETIDEKAFISEVEKLIEAK